jgi:hypothetical protein
MKWQADWLLAKGGERKGKGSYSSYSKFVGLTIATLVFTPYSYFKKRKNYKVTEINFQKTTVLLCQIVYHMLLATLIDKLKVL